MSSVFTSVQSGQHVGNTISDEMLGINMRSHHNRTDDDSAFRQVMEQMGTNSIRFPGGTVSEEHFDITNPNATRVTNALQLIHPEIIPARTNGVPVTRTVTPLSEYLDFVNELGGDAVIVLPTYRFFDQNTRRLTSNAESDIRTFVRELFQDEYGTVDRATLEIGNEYFQSSKVINGVQRFNWSDAEFARLQADIALIVDSELRSIDQRENLTLLAQGGHVRNNNAPLTQANNATQAAAFMGAAGAAIDGVILHFYGTSGTHNPLAIVPSVPDVLAGTHAAWGPALGPDFQIAVTEWNIGEDGEQNTVMNGMMRTPALLNMFAEMVEGGVDMAQIWAARVDGPGGLASRQEAPGELTPTGKFFAMLADSTLGLNLVNSGAGSELRNASGQHVGYTYTFEGTDRSVTYFASGIDQTLALTADMSRLIGEGAYVYARVLDTAPGDAVNDYNADATMSYSTDVQLIPTSGGVQYQAELKAFQLIELHVVYGQGVSIEGAREVRSADRLVGSDFDDFIWGHDGHDKLRGNAGDDTLDGGFGADVLRGNAGTDQMMGGVGRDRLIGGKGDDELHGGRGNDRLLGHNDNDLLFGEAGRDHLFGDNGNDVLFGGRGHDSMFGGNGTDTLSGDAGHDLVQGDAGDDSVSGGNGRDTLFGGAGDDRLDGGRGADTLAGGTGDDTLTGGAGGDGFVFARRGGTDTVVDFDAASDFLDLTDFVFNDLADLMDRAVDTDAGVEFELGAAESVVLQNVDLNELSAENFVI